MNTKKEHLKKLSLKLETMLCDDECMASDILDVALAVVSQQARIIRELEMINKELGKGIEDNYKLAKEIVKNMQIKQ